MLALALVPLVARAQEEPCDDPPVEEEPVKCEAELEADSDREIDLSALLGAPRKPPAASGCRRTLVSVSSGTDTGVTERLAAVDDALAGCAAAARARTPTLSGTGRFELTVDGSGKVSAVSTTSTTLTDADLAGCFQRAFATARFTPSARVVLVAMGCKAPQS